MTTDDAPSARQGGQAAGGAGGATGGSGAGKPPWRARLRHAFNHTVASLAFFAIVLAILIGILWREVIITVPAGSVGVMWYRFFGGTVLDSHLGEGLRVIFPWDKIFIYDARPQRTDMTIPALTEEGLAIRLHLTITTIVNPATIGNLHKAIGPRYLELVVEPLVAGSVRELVAGYAPDEIYDLARRDIEPRLIAEVNKRIDEKPLNSDAPGAQLVRISKINLREVELPTSIERAIEEKLAAEQAALRYQYVLQREKLETQRKEIEALGIKRFQEIVTPTISEEYLRWRGIDATLQLALSPNAKVVVIGGGADGLPLILDGTGGGGTPTVAAGTGASPPQTTTDTTGQTSMFVGPRYQVLFPWEQDRAHSTIGLSGASPGGGATGAAPARLGGPEATPSAADTAADAASFAGVADAAVGAAGPTGSSVRPSSPYAFTSPAMSTQRHPGHGDPEDGDSVRAATGGTILQPHQSQRVPVMPYPIAPVLPPEMP